MAQLSIGEIAHILNVSRRTLRYYEEVGIVVPKSRGSNNYRYYDTGDLNRLQAVMLMRKAGLSIKEVLETMGPPLATAVLLESESGEFATGQEIAHKISARLRDQRTRLFDKVAEIQSTIDSIDRSIHALEACLGCVTSVKLDDCVECQTGCSEVTGAAAHRRSPCVS